MFQTYPVPLEGDGALFLMPCPPAGDLEAVLNQLRAEGVTHVLSMLPQEEAFALGVESEASLCAAIGITFLSYSIPDFGLPDLAPFGDLVDHINALLNQQARIAIHCRAGIGRTGMVAACVLIARGEAGDIARNRVSAARGVSIPDTVEQGNFITEFAQQPKKATY